MRRIISLSLAVIMLISLLPATFAADTAETIRLDFTQANVDMSPTEGTTSLLMSDWKVSGESFKFKSAFCIGTIAEYTTPDGTGINRLYFRGGFTVNGCSANDSEDEVSASGGANSYTWPTREKSLTITTNIENAGYYRVDLSGYKYKDASLFSVYVNREYVGDYNFYDVNADAYTLKKESLNVIELPAGEVEITFKLRKNYGSGEGRFYLASLELVPQGADYEHKLSEVEVPELKDGALTLVLGDEKEMSAKAKMKDGSYRQFGYTIKGKLPEADIISVESDSDAVSVSDVICVEADNCENNGSRDATQDIDPKTTTFTLTANALGTANITVTALLGGKPTTKTFTVNVPAPAGVMNFVFNAGAYGETEAIERDGLEALDTAKTFATQGTNEWRMTSYYDLEANRKPQLGTDGLNWDFWKARLTSDADPIAAIVLKVTPGTYLPTVTYEPLPTGYNAGIYLIPESKLKETKTSGSTTFVPLDNGIEYKFGSNIYLYRYFGNSEYYALTAAEEESYLVGEIDMYEQEQDVEPESIDLDITDLEEETYYLFIKENGANPNMTVTPSAMFYSLKLTPVSAQEKAEAAFDYAESNHEGTGNASITAYAVYGTDGEVVDTQTIENMPSVTYGEVCESITAPEAPDGYKFLYWAKGMTMGKKQVVSYSATIPEYKPHEGVNYLIAVYEEVGANTDTIEFYNANGQLLDLTLTEENKLPDLPSMAGYGKATAWALRNADGTYTEYEAGADVSARSGTLVFMAKYNDLEKDIKIVINGEDGYYAYGDPVPCTSDAADFSYWTKTVNGKTEIVSTKSAYTFNAYEACTVTAVCEGTVDLGKTMRKIILSTFAAGEETAIMAEFIGFDGALEKGIMFGNQKIAMNTDKTQFTVINDAEGSTTVTGYAIVDDGGTNKKITDAEITVGE